MRKINFVNGEYYHIYNRGIDKRDIFLDEDDFWKFFNGLRDFNNKTNYELRLNALGIHTHDYAPTTPSSLQFKELGSFLKQQEKMVDAVSYCINPNHFHLILKQRQDRGISNVMHKLGLSCTNHFNKKYNHSGHIFQGPFKAVHIDSNDYLLWLIGYVNGNIEIHGLADAKKYPWSSYQAISRLLANSYGQGQGLSNLSVLSGLEDIILPQFKNENEFRDFVKYVIAESRTKKEMEKYLLENL